MRARLRAATDTLDAAGRAVREAPPCTSREVDEALRGCVCAIAQRPPVFSANRRGERRLYEWALRNVEVERAPVAVHVFSLACARFAPPQLDLDLELECGAGFYVRALVDDLGARLGSAAHLAALRPVAGGPFAEAAAVQEEAWGLEAVCAALAASPLPMHAHAHARAAPRLEPRIAAQ
jgi:tRNA pseudouridine55 synthase